MEPVRQVSSILKLVIGAKANQHSFCTNPDAILYVGEPVTAFHVEMDVVCDASPVLKAAFTGGFKESKDKTMSFPEEDAINFGRFLEWTYGGWYHLSMIEPDGTAEDRIMELAKLYVLADRYDVVKLKHNIIDRMFDFGWGCSPTYGPPFRVIRYVYENCTHLSFFRKLVASWYLRTRPYDSPFLNRELVLEDEIPDLVADIRAEFRLRGDTDPFSRDRIFFYEPLQPTLRLTYH
ncbi:hypothetical protein MMC22_007511 [Lobaria immixta]|nr:hypothetical protein [Lobaria immixta]